MQRRRLGRRTASGPLDVRALPDPVPSQILDALGVPMAWKPEPQDRAFDGILRGCRDSSWARDPASAHGIVCPQRSTLFRAMEAVASPSSGGSLTRPDQLLSADETARVSALLRTKGLSTSDIKSKDSRWAVVSKDNGTTSSSRRRGSDFDGTSLDPFAEWPWEQSLLVHTADSYTMLGRRPPLAAPENSLVQRVRGNRLLDPIRHSDSQQQVRRITRLFGELADITSTLNMSRCDLLFASCPARRSNMYKDTTTFPSRPSKLSTTSVHNQTFLQDWGFPPEHCHVTARQLGVFTGFGGLQHCAPDRADLGQPFPQPAELDEAPFLNQMMFLLHSRDLPPLALARCLSRARFGSWSSDRRAFSQRGHTAKASR